MNDHTDIRADDVAPIPADFLFDREHPVLPIPFTLHLPGGSFQGLGLSLTALHLGPPPQGARVGRAGARHLAKLEFNCEGFSIDLYPEVTVTASDAQGAVLQFTDPTGAHLPQLRYILNSFIAGDLVSLGGLLGHTGPTRVKPAKSDQGADRVGAGTARRVAAVALSGLLILGALAAIYQRYTTSYEPRPVFVTRQGNDMRATSPGQITFLNPEAKSGEVLYAISANSGDTLNFLLPCACEVALASGIYSGATVLPSDPILTIFDTNVQVRVQTQMSIEGLTKAVNGEQVYLDMSDGRAIPVQVVQTSATSEAALRGDLYMPVVLLPDEGALNVADIGKPARVRLKRQIFPGLI
ncbi:MAG: hypothetical protein GW905_07780 [Rhodobacterales bacterium]|nr:hypothetical protein [Rhodobacterales bacterium]